MAREITKAQVVLATLKGENPPEVKRLEDAALAFSIANSNWFRTVLYQHEDPALLGERDRAFGCLQQAALDFADFVDRTARK